MIFDRDVKFNLTRIKFHDHEINTQIFNFYHTILLNINKENIHNPPPPDCKIKYASIIYIRTYEINPIYLDSLVIMTMTTTTTTTTMETLVE